MAAPEQRVLTPEERQQLGRRLTFILRALGLAFGGSGLALGVLVALAGAFTPPALISAMTLTGAVWAATAVLVGFLWLLGRSKRRALLDGALLKGAGRVEKVDLPNDGGGGSTRVELTLTLPNGEKRQGQLRVHAAGSRRFQQGQELVLWFAEDQSTFLLEDLIGADPGTVGPS